MKSLGVIETRGLVAAVQAVDAACKSAGVSCIGYRKIASGLVSVCFEGEINAIHTAIERGITAAAVIDPQSKSLVIARPEPRVVEALNTLTGCPMRPKASAVVPFNATTVEPTAAGIEEPTETASPLAPVTADDKNPAIKKGKKA
ncbi:BMC domain-containing protein [Pantoea septica]|uniref:BMC domain-containing protein n=1 Tax=Pantoea septica TaxID=472695 RepID=UPI003CFF6FAE